MVTSNGHANGTTDTGGHAPWDPTKVPEGMDEHRFRAVLQRIDNAMSSRAEFFKKFFDPRRNINQECGYPTGPQSPEWYNDLADDGYGIAARVNEVLSRESWQVQPTVYESEDTEDVTEFERAWDALSKTLRGTEEGLEQSWYADELGSPVWDYLQRVDEQSGKGRYGILLLGFDDVEQDDGLRNPVTPGKYKPLKDDPPGGPPEGKNLKVARPKPILNARGGRRLLYLRCFPEHLCPVARFDSDPGSPRYGKPEAYNVTFVDLTRGSQTGTGLNLSTREVHWSRVIHVADNLADSVGEVYGVERCRPVRNQLLGLQKLYGGSPEMYWKGAFPGVSITTHPQLGGEPTVNLADTRSAMENYMNGLQRYLILMGMSATTLAPTVADPTPQKDVLIEAICIKLGIPVRVFKGSERGELASSQDDAAWNDRLRFRQNMYITPRLIVPFVNRLIAAGVLPEPEEGYYVEWPDLTSQTQAEKADVAVKKTQALSQYVSGGVEALVPPQDYLTRVMDMDEKDALAILENAAKHAEEKAEQDMEQQQAMIDQGLAPPTPGTPAAIKAGADQVAATTAAKAAAGQPPASPLPPMPMRPRPPVKNATVTRAVMNSWAGDGELPELEDTMPVTFNYNPSQKRWGKGTRFGGRWVKATDGVPVGSPKALLTQPVRKLGPVAARYKAEPQTPPPPGQYYRPDVHTDRNRDGVTDQARVGVAALSVPPPPPVGRLPNLTPRERAVEGKFIEAFNRDPDGMADAFRDLSRMTTKRGDPITFGTDDAKHLVEDWSHPGLTPEQRAHNRATLNLALHQTANAIAKRAFLRELDTLKPGQEVLVTVGGCGCHVADTPIMLSDGSLKMVQDIRVGDTLMGPDSKPRKVLRLIRGVGKLHKITPKKGKSFTVNEDHVLSFYSNRGPGTGKRTRKLRTEMTVKEVLSRGKSFLRSALLHRTGVEFPYQPVALDPYYLGIWLGNGTKSQPTVTTMDGEVAGYVRKFAGQFGGVEVVERVKSELVAGRPNKAKDYKIALVNKYPGKGTTNPVLDLLRQAGVLNNKHIPQEYLKNDRQTRLRLLAGLLDTDGSVGNGCFEFGTKDERMAYDVAYLARSLGFAAYAKPKWAKTQFIDEPRIYWRVSIHGNVDQIPTLVARKQAGPRRINKDHLRVGFGIEPAGEGRYYGFTLEGDGLYLLDDFTVTHNSGKGYALKNVPQALAMKQRASVVWDSAGDQNATENPWIQAEAERRGLRVSYVYVHADPYQSWAHPERGVVKRAGDPNDGRMVDAHVFADSYALGARNHQRFYEANRDNPSASFVFLSNTGKPALIPDIPPEATRLNARKLTKFALRTVQESDAPARVKRGATMGVRVWGGAS